MTPEIVSIEPRILTIRGQKVMLDRDLAALYGVATKALNQAVKRNIKRFPAHFMFQLSRQEKQELVTNCDHLKALKYSPTLPYAFTEHGVAMLSSVLNSERAIQINIQIIDAFIAVRRYALATKPQEITRRVALLEKVLLQYIGKTDRRIDEIVETLNEMLSADETDLPQQIGFIKE
ncbi:MAG: ORF6N domain-containing protein [Elusimicrobiaceae bacterium]|nr:ORF6N domain-containing protein [Elusimicrobiaceae bacterium]